MKIFAHTLVYNEENFIWFAVSSVVSFVDKVMIWDSGSTDSTVKIIKCLQKEFPKKIEFKEVGRVDSNGVTRMRQKMLEESDCEWVIILDGDEIWPKYSIKKVIKEVSKNNNMDAVVVPFFMLLGDVYHFQEELAGKNELVGKKGHLQIRAINKNISGLHIVGTYPLESFVDKSGKSLQKSDKLIYLEDAPYLHASHLKRSSKRGQTKFKYELGTKFPINFKYPEVFYSERPDIIHSPWIKRDVIYEGLMYLRTPLVWLKRRIK